MIIIVSAVSLSTKVLDKLETGDKELVISKPPNQKHIIKVIEKGRGFHFVDPTVVISYKKYKIQCEINNDIKDLTPSDISISWKNNEEATILLFGEKQSPEVFEFKVPNKVSKSNPFQVVQRKLGFIPFQKSESPNHVNVVELRRNTYSKGMMHSYDKVPIQVYYGKMGTTYRNMVSF